MNVSNINSKPMKINNILLLLLCLSLQLFAQDDYNKQLKGVVYDNNSQQPLMYANLTVLNSSVGVISNEQGQYALDISSFDF